MKEQFFLVYSETDVYSDGEAILRSIPCGNLHGVVENMVKHELSVGQGDVIVIQGVRVKDDEIRVLLESRRTQYREEQRQLHEAVERANYERLKAKFEGTNA